MEIENRGTRVVITDFDSMDLFKSEDFKYLINRLDNKDDNVKDDKEDKKV